MRRRNRFVGEFRFPGQSQVHSMYVPNPGRLKTLFVEGTPVLVHDHADPARKHRYSCVLARVDDHLVAIGSLNANRLVKAALQARALEPLAHLAYDRNEYPIPGSRSRVDFLLRDPRREARWLVEVKSCTHVEAAGVARFPDAPTARGRRHVRELTAWLQKPGWRAAVLFVVQDPRARRVEPFDSTDPEFGTLLRAAHAAGVGVHAFTTRVSLTKMCLAGEIPVVL